VVAAEFGGEHRRSTTTTINVNFRLPERRRARWAVVGGDGCGEERLASTRRPADSPVRVNAGDGGRTPEWWTTCGMIGVQDVTWCETAGVVGRRGVRGGGGFLLSV